MRFSSGAETLSGQTLLLFQILNAICVFFILLSIINLIVSTIPSFHHCTGDEFLGIDDDESASTDDNVTAILHTTINNTTRSLSNTANLTANGTSGSTSFFRRRTIKDKFSHTCEGGFIFDIIETVCIAWFTVEWVIRFFTCPHKSEFMKSPLNLIDMFATVPFYVELLIWASEAADNSSVLLQFLRVMRIIRVFRIFRLARYFDSLQVMAETLWNSRSELGLLIMFLAVSSIIFSTILFYIEREVPGSSYTSIPATFWWCVVTLTTTVSIGS